jgi:hypothetical protein
MGESILEVVYERILEVLDPIREVLQYLAEEE